MSQERDSQLEEEERGRRTREETFFWCWPPMSSTHFRIERSAANMEDDRKKNTRRGQHNTLARRMDMPQRDFLNL